MISTKLASKATTPDAIADRIRAEIQALARAGHADLALSILDEEAYELRLRAMSKAELEKEIGHVAPDYAHSVRRLRLVSSRTEVLNPETPDAPWSA